MNTRLQRKASQRSHPMVQTMLPEPFDEGPVETRLIRLSKWAANVHPGRTFSLRELSRLTGIPYSTLRDLQCDAVDKIATQLMEIGNEFINRRTETGT